MSSPLSPTTNSDSSSSSEWEDDEKPSAKMPPPATPASKQPEPSFKVPQPKGATPNAKTEITSPAQNKPESAKKKTHVYYSASVSSLRRAAQGSDIASPASSPSRAAGSRLRAYSPNLFLKQNHTSDVSTIHSREEPEPETDETDDDASVAESFVSNIKIRRNEAERIDYFRNQPECGDIEPHCTFCTRCNKHVPR
ncbi:hypothetical protein GGF50DRAFT_112953 [Schizophyllum commune]